MSKIYECGRCEDTGVVAVPNGPDDQDVEFCVCEYGKAARELETELEVRMA
jgi:hypothetical protein